MCWKFSRSSVVCSQTVDHFCIAVVKLGNRQSKQTHALRMQDIYAYITLQRFLRVVASAYCNGASINPFNQWFKWMQRRLLEASQPSKISTPALFNAGKNFMIDRTPISWYFHEKFVLFAVAGQPWVFSDLFFSYRWTEWRRVSTYCDCVVSSLRQTRDCSTREIETQFIVAQ